MSYRSFSPRQFFFFHSCNRTFADLTAFLRMCSEHPSWKRLINHTLTMDERISLITEIFTDSNQTQMVANLSGDDAQAFVDVIDEVGPYTISYSEDKLH